MKKFLFTFFIVIISVFIFNACSDDDSASPSCDGCSSSTPWSKPGINSCYATKSSCESAQGGTCQICN